MPAASASRLPVLLCATLLLLAPAAPAADLPAPATKKISFRDDIYPLLSARCLRCHKGTSPTSGHRLDLRSELLGESNGRPLVVPGASAKSRLVQVIAGHVPDRLMPPEGRGKRLSPEQVALFRAWIDQGLSWDDKLLPPQTFPAHWAFRPLLAPTVPAVKNAHLAATPVDVFILARLEARGLAPNPEAPRHTLIRRLSLDLTGLPPSPEEVAAFEADNRPDAYERLVDRLLASPAYGERWGRHWLDLARWAESEGYESNHPRLYAWRYRDYVVESFNRDKPFAEFVRQQIAGDEISPYSDENLIATGFLASARLSSNEEDKPRQRNDVLVDVVNATAATFLGLTFHCAQCHNHKFDPISARDYYRFMGFFVKGQPANLELRDKGLWAKYEAVRPAAYEPARKEKEALFDAAHARLVAGVKKAWAPAMVRAVATPEEKRTPEEERLAHEADLLLQFSPNRIEKALLPEERTRYDRLKKQLADLEKHMLDRPQTFGFYSPATSPTRIETLPMKGFYPLPYEPAQLGRARTHLLVGGDVHRRGVALQPGWPAVFGPTPAKAVERTPRLALADWLTGANRALTARVWANRVWQHHLGRGIVRTPNDFGVKGVPPTHPELLDWLASEFLRCGGSTKHLHRVIVLSRTYRQASTASALNVRLDPDNVLWWRWSPRRLEAEAFRDAMLSVSGELDRSAGGPSDKDEVKSRRRGLYLFQNRDRPPALQGLFDGPSAAAESCPKRAVSTTPLHALFTLNNKFPVGRARAFARRVMARAGADRDRQVREAFLLALGRAPTPEESAAVARFLARAGEREKLLVDLCHALLCANEFSYLE